MTTSPLKTCCKCGQEKCVSEFYKHKSAHDGLQTSCKACQGLYQKQRTPPARVTPDSKTCLRCKEEKPSSEFYKDLRCKDGLQPLCKVCNGAAANASHDRNREEINRRARLRDASHPERKKAKNKLRRWSRYKITETDYLRMVERQGGVCAICGEPPTSGKTLCIDHDHKTGRLRKLLCDPCNMALGLFTDSIFKLNSAINYLIAHTPQPNEPAESRSYGFNAPQ